MKLHGEHTIEAPRAAVWDALHDPALLAQCIPGCQHLEWTGTNEMAGTVRVRAGPLVAPFELAVRVAHADEPARLALAGEGRGGAQGRLWGTATVRLSQADGTTVLSYDVEASAAGRIGELGPRVLEPTAARLAADALAALAVRAALASRPVRAAPARSDPPAPRAPQEGPGEPSSSGPVRPEPEAPPPARQPLFRETPAPKTPGQETLGQETVAAAPRSSGPGPFVPDPPWPARRRAPDPPAHSAPEPPRETAAGERSEAGAQGEDPSARWSRAGAALWGILAFAVTILVLIALQ